MVELPNVDAGKLRVRDWVLELFTALCAFALAVLFAGRLFANDEHRSQVLGILTIALILLVIAIVKAVRVRAKEHRESPPSPPKEFVGLLRTLHCDACNVIGCDPEFSGVIRAALHRVNWDRRKSKPMSLTQITNYVGGRGGNIGHQTPIGAGIIGKCARTREIQWARRAAETTDDQYRSDLVSDWGFTWDQANARRLDRQSWLAMHIVERDESRPIGVLYMDSSEPLLGNGDHHATEVRQLAFKCTQTLAEIVHA